MLFRGRPRGLPSLLLASAGFIKLGAAIVLGQILFPADSSPVFRTPTFSPLPEAQSGITPAETLGRLIEDALAASPGAPWVHAREIDRAAFKHSLPEVQRQLDASLAAYGAKRPERALDILSRAEPADPNVLLLQGLAQRAVAEAARERKLPLDHERSGIDALRRAAEAGQAQAELFLTRWQSSGQTDDESTLALAQRRLREGEISTALDLLATASANGDTTAQTVLGIYHLAAFSLGRSTDPGAAATLLAQAATAGDLDAAYHLGLLHRDIAAEAPWHDPAKAAALFADCAEALHLDCLVAQAEDPALEPAQAYAVLALASLGGSEVAERRLTKLKGRLDDATLSEGRSREEQLVTRHSRPAPRTGATLLTLREEARRLSTKGAKAPPPDSLDRVLDRDELAILERLPGLLRAEEGTGYVDRAWFGAVSPTIAARFDETANLIELGEMARAQNLVAGLAAQQEANALYLSALAATADPVKPKVSREILAKMMHAADLGHPDAAVQLGHYAWAGRGVPRDAQAARRWYEIARDRGSARASTALGDILISGRWLEKDVVAALNHYEDAAAAGDTGAMTRLGILNLEGKEIFVDYVTARHWLERAADAHGREAQWLLADTFARDDGRVSDRAAFLRWAGAAADQGHPVAMTALGRHYLEEASERALVWLRGGALRNDPKAQYLFANLISDSDPVKAVMFYSLALRNRHEPARAPLEHLISSLDCDQLTRGTNAYRAYDKIAFWTRGLRETAPKRRRKDPLRQFEDLTSCEITPNKGLKVSELLRSLETTQ